MIKPHRYYTSFTACVGEKKEREKETTIFAKLSLIAYARYAEKQTDVLLDSSFREAKIGIFGKSNDKSLKLICLREVRTAFVLRVEMI